MSRKRALITGITGQDGSYLAEYLLNKNYEVHGLVRPKHLRDFSKGPENISHIIDELILHPGLLENQLSISHAIRVVEPDECYHLAGPSFVEVSFEEEPSILSAHVNGTHALLASIKEIVPDCKFFHAGSSEMFGNSPESPQNEKTNFNPRSIYGLAKLSGFHIIKYYREKYGLYGCTGILFNHESPRRAPEFIPRKVSLSVARIKLGLQKEILIGNIDSERDWGYAPEYVEAMWLMLNFENPEDFVISTGKTHSVRELLNCAFNSVELDYNDYIKIDKKYYRPKEKISLCGCNKNIRDKLGWEPKRSFNDIIGEMVSEDIKRLQSIL